MHGYSSLWLSVPDVKSCQHFQLGLQNFKIVARELKSGVFALFCLFNFQFLDLNNGFTLTNNRPILHDSYNSIGSAR